MNDPKFLRVETLFPSFQRAGCRIAVITAKDKLRGLLGKGLELGAGKACSFSSEKSDKATLGENGIDKVNALVGMDVWKNHRIHELANPFVCRIRRFAFEPRQVDHANDPPLVRHQFASDGASAHPIDGLPHRHLSW